MRLRFWLKTGLETFGVIVGATAFYSVMMFLQSSSATWEDILLTLPMFFLLFGGVMFLAMTIGVYKLSVPLVLSFGSTRNEVLVGLQIAHLMPVVLTTALVTVLIALGGANSVIPLSAAIPAALGIYLMFSAFGVILGVVITHFGKVAGVITAIVIMLGAFCGGFFAAFSEDGAWLMELVERKSLPWLALSIGLMLYSVSMIPEHRTVWRCNVKL